MAQTALTVLQVISMCLGILVNVLCLRSVKKEEGTY